MAASIDPVTLEIIKGRIRSARTEMETILERTAMSPFIREKKDYFVAYFDAGGHLVFGTNLPLGGNVLDCILERFPVESMRPGDIYCYNDPYLSHGGVSHTPDLVFAAPVFADGALVAFSECWAHFWDIGGLMPGTLSPLAREIFHEGLLLPPVRLYRQGELNADVFDILLRNTRFPEITRGDLRALIAACRLGETRMLEILAQFGRQTTEQAFATLIAETEQVARAQIRRRIPEGTFHFEDWIDTDVISGNAFAVRMAMTHQDGRISIDTRHSDDQAPGAINFIMHDSVPKMVLGMYMVSEDPTVLLNDGLIRAVDEVLLRTGSILQPRHPAPVGMRGHTLSRVQSSVFGLVAQATGGQGPAASSPYVIYLMRGLDKESHQFFLINEGVAVGFGARPYADGIDAVYFVGQKNFPMEFMEHEFPLMVHQYTLHTDSAGPGRWRGGCGIVRDVQLLAEEAQLATRMDGVRFPAWGVNGGQCGRPGRIILNPGTEREQEVPAVGDGCVVRRGDIVRFMTTGGGGWGNPAERPAALVRRDVAGGMVSLAAAERDYGVVLDPASLAVDEAATAERRREMLRRPVQMFHRFGYYQVPPFAAAGPAEEGE